MAFEPNAEQLANGQTVGGGRFGVGALSYFLKNRFYIGEVAYHGEIHQAEHEPILDRTLFEEVQAMLAKNNVERRLKLKASPSLLAGRIYDDRGNRMTPSHAGKNGVRYRYYVSNAVLQKKDKLVGSVPRVPAAEIEELVTRAVRTYCQTETGSVPESNEEPLARLARAVITPAAIKLHIIDRELSVSLEPHTDEDRSLNNQVHEPTIVSVPWELTKFAAVKGVVHMPSQSVAALKPESRDVLLTAIANAREWIDDLVSGRVATIGELAHRENRVERHVRLLLPLAFVEPAIVRAIVSGSAPAYLTVTGLAKSAPHSWGH